MTAPAGSEDAERPHPWCERCGRPKPLGTECGYHPTEATGLGLSAEEREALGCRCVAWRPGQVEDDPRRHVAGCPGLAVECIVAAHLEAVRAEERERIARAIDEAPGFRRWIDDSRVVDKDVAIRIARTSPPAGDAQEARNGPVGDEDAGGGRGWDDESGRGARL